MKKGLQVHYDGHHENPGWWVVIWKPGRTTPKRHMRPYGSLWVCKEQTNDPSPTPSSIGRCLRLLAKLNEDKNV